MPAVVTLRMIDPNGGDSVPAYLADGSEQPIIWDNGDEALAWAYMHRSLFESGPAERVVRDRFGVIVGEFPEGMLENRRPCCLLDDDFIQEGNELIDVGTGDAPISLKQDLNEYEQRLNTPPDQRPFN